MVSNTCTRRQIISVGMGIAFPLISGCSALSSTESDSELGQITVENSDDTSHIIHVVVERDSDLIYGSTHELEAVSAPEDDDNYGSIDSAILENNKWDGTTGGWMIYTRVDGQTSWNEHEIPADDESTCYSVRLKIEVDSSVTSFTPDCDSWPPSSDT
ncbi:hypothetical protein ACFQO4_08825 [Saliphagus sp. GCM10025334]